MKNVQEILIEKNLEFILPRYKLYNNMTIEVKTAVVVHLYYLDKFNDYWYYLKNICAEIDIYLISSNPDLLKKAEEQKNVLNKSNIYLIKKENRGRDISALLVAFGKKIYEYEYICFIHDKKEKFVKHKQDILFWNENLWKNMIGSDEHIKNILYIFENNPNIGLLVPPKPSGDHIRSDFRDSWGPNYNNTVRLAEELGLNCQFDSEISPVALGSVFWCRTSALYKLFEREWVYEDFTQEPLPIDGTISHAIERIFPFVAQDAGFDTGIVMHEYYAAKYQHNLIRNMSKIFDILDSVLGISSKVKFWEYEAKIEKVCEYFDQHENTYIYGAGKGSKQCLKALQLNGKIPKGVIITKNTLGTKDYLGIPLIELNDYEHKEQNGIIISIINEAYINEVVEIMSERNIKDYIIY